MLAWWWEHHIAFPCMVRWFWFLGKLLARLMGQYFSARWCLLSAVVVCRVCNAAGRPAGRMDGRSADTPRRASTVTYRTIRATPVLIFEALIDDCRVWERSEPRSASMYSLRRRTLSVRVTGPPAECTFCVPRASQLANSVTRQSLNLQCCYRLWARGGDGGKVYPRAGLLYSRP